MNDFLNSIKAEIQQVRGAGSSEKTERDYSFFTLDENETKTYRFITGFDYMTILKCDSCDLDNYEVPQSQFQEARENGAPMACPVCGKVFDDSHIKATRPRALKYDRVHNFVPVGGNKRSFVCQGPGCKICAVKDANGKQSYPPKSKLIMYGIEVEKKRGETQLVGGVPRSSIESVVPVVDDNGKLNIVQFERPASFFHVLFDTFLENARCDHHAFDITRTGTGQQTRYVMTRVPAEATAFDYTLYGPRLEAIIAETEKLYANLGSQEYYDKSGWGNGSASQQAAPNQFAQSSQPMTATQNQFVQSSQSQTASWNDAVSQINAHNNGTVEQYL